MPALGRRLAGLQAWASLQQGYALRIAEAQGADIVLLQGLLDDFLQAWQILALQGARSVAGDLLGEQVAALLQLRMQLLEVQPGEISPQQQCQQTTGQQGQHDYPALDAKILEHVSYSLRSGCSLASPCIGICSGFWHSK